MKPYLKIVATAAVGFVCALAMPGKPAAQPQRPTDEYRKHYMWLLERLQEAESIKTGMTKAELLKVFTPDGGIQHSHPQPFVLRSCNLIKMDVEFDGLEGSNFPNLPSETELKIESISKPYLEPMHMD